MKRAFSLSPSTRASRDSLLELTRNHRHSLQVRQGLLYVEENMWPQKYDGFMMQVWFCLNESQSAV